MYINLSQFHRFCLCLAAFITGEFIASAINDSPCDEMSAAKVYHGMGFNMRPSYIMPTHGFYNGWNPMGRPLRAGGSAHLDYFFSYLPDTEQGRLFPGAYQGIGLGVQTFLAHDAMGTPVSLYLFQGAPVAILTDCLTLDYEWNFGLSAGWKPNEYMLTGSVLNAYINVGLYLKWKMNAAWDLQIGPEYTHYSNGDTAFPNAGANTVNFRIGVRRHFDCETGRLSAPKLFSFENKSGRFMQNVTCDLTLFGAWRADRMIVDNRLHIIDKSFLVAGLQLNPLYHFNQSLSIGPALDLIYDRSANLQASSDEGEVLTYSNPGFIRQCAAGISIRGELQMPIFAVNVGVGYNFSYAGSDLRGIYGIFVLKTFVTDSLFLNAGYRLGTVLYAHNLMFGLGWRFGN